MSKLIVVSAGEAERHSADRILGAMETASRITLTCVDGLDQPGPEPAAGDIVLLVAGDGWSERIVGGAAQTLLEQARTAGARVHVVLIDDGAEPDEVALPESLLFLAGSAWHHLRQDHWATDVAALIDALAEPMPLAAGPLRPSPARQMLLAAALVGALALLGAILIMSRMWSDTPTAVGRWVAEVDYGRADVREEQFDFRQAGGQIAGSVTWQGVRRAVEGAVQDGERLSFHTRTHENRGSERREVRHDYAGIVSEDVIDFTLRSSGGFDEPAPLEFTARRVRD